MWYGWCVNEGYLGAHYAHRPRAMAPLPNHDGRKPGDQQAWIPEQCHTLTRHVDEYLPLASVDGSVVLGGVFLLDATGVIQFL